MAGYCIYQITNKINGHRYIGQHKYKDESNLMGNYKGSGVLLHKAYKKYGIENFEIEVLYKRIRDKATVNAMEIWAIDRYKPEYNIARGGTGGYTGPKSEKWYTSMHKLKGHPCWHRGHSEEEKRKISEANKGKKHSAEWNKKVSDAQKGRTIPDERKKRISDTLKSKSSEIFTENYKRNHSEVMKEWWRQRKCQYK